MKEHLLNLRKLNIRTVNEEWTRIIGGFECLLEQEESLHHARLARTIRASEDGQGPDLNRLPCVNRLESADRDSRDGSAGCSRPDGTFSPWPLSLVDRADSLLLNVGE